MTDAYREALERRPANFQPLTPLGFLARSAGVFPERVATWSDGAPVGCSLTVLLYCFQK